MPRSAFAASTAGDAREVDQRLQDARHARHDLAAHTVGAGLVERDGVVDDGHDIPSSSDFRRSNWTVSNSARPPISKRARIEDSRRPPP